MTSKTTKTILIAGVIMTLMCLLEFTNAFAVVSYPSIRSDWESHDADDGTKTTIAYKNPTVYNPPSTGYYWWAKSFTSWGAYSINLDEGAVGAGTVKYIPLSGTTKHVAFVYDWDEDAGAQVWTFGNSVSSSKTASVQNTSGSTWSRISDTISNNKTVPGLTWGHSKVGMLQSHSSSTMDGSFTSNQIRQTTGWDTFETSTQLAYCENGYGASGKQVDLVSDSANNLKFGSSAAENNCSTLHFNSDMIPA